MADELLFGTGSTYFSNIVATFHSLEIHNSVADFSIWRQNLDAQSVNTRTVVTEDRVIEIVRAPISPRDNAEYDPKREKFAVHLTAQPENINS